MEPCRVRARHGLKSDTFRRAYDSWMRRAVALLLATLTVASCSGSTTEPPPPLDTEASSTQPSTTTSTTTSATTLASDPTTTTTTIEEPASTDAPPTTVDDATLLAQAEAAYFEAWEVGIGAIRNPDDPENEERIRDHFAKNNLELNLENLRLTEEGNFIAIENIDNPSFAQTYGDIDFTSDARDEVFLTVCEFYSDRLYERGTAPDGSDVLVRDDPQTIILVVELVLDEGRWKAATGGPPEIVKDEVERCTTAT